MANIKMIEALLLQWYHEKEFFRKNFKSVQRLDSLFRKIDANFCRTEVYPIEGKYHMFLLDNLKKHFKFLSKENQEALISWIYDNYLWKS